MLWPRRAQAQACVKCMLEETEQRNRNGCILVPVLNLWLDDICLDEMLKSVAGKVPHK